MKKVLADTYREAMACFEAGDLSAAQRLVADLLARNPDKPALLALKGAICGQLGETREALDSFAAALRLDHKHPGLYFNHGLAARKLGELEAAADSFAKAVELKPDWAEAHFQVGDVARLRNDRGQALAHLQRALALSPDYVPALGALALLYERNHELDLSRECALRALQLAPGDATANLTIAQLDVRSGELDTAKARSIEVLTLAGLSAQNQAYAHGLLGDIYDRQGKYKHAFASFCAANAALKEQYSSTNANKQSVYDLDSIARISAFHKVFPIAEWQTFVPSEPLRLALLIGFPRSGTTLLEQVLASHPDITSIEEQPTLDYAMRATLFSDSELQQLPQLPRDEIENFRRAYLQKVKNHLPDFDPGSGQLVIDKLPLNTVVLGLIWRLFPEARIIRAIRDPRAVVMSCFKHNFGANEAMAHMLSLDAIADYYAAVMRLGNHFERELPLAQQRIRYEDLVDDLEGETRSLLTFLDVAWDPSVLDYRDTAKQQPITTPSYSQVVQPLYERSKQNWRHYESQLEPVLPTLEPFIREFGYR